MAPSPQRRSQRKISQQYIATHRHSESKHMIHVPLLKTYLGLNVFIFWAAQHRVSEGLNKCCRTFFTEALIFYTAQQPPVKVFYRFGRSSRSSFSPIPPVIFTGSQQVWNLTSIPTPLFFEPLLFPNEATHRDQTFPFGAAMMELCSECSPQIWYSLRSRIHIWYIVWSHHTRPTTRFQGQEVKGQGHSVTQRGQKFAMIVVSYILPALVCF